MPNPTTIHQQPTPSQYQLQHYYNRWITQLLSVENTYQKRSFWALQHNTKTESLSHGTFGAVFDSVPTSTTNSLRHWRRQTQKSLHSSQLAACTSISANSKSQHKNYLHWTCCKAWVSTFMRRCVSMCAFAPACRSLKHNYWQTDSPETGFMKFKPELQLDMSYTVVF